MRQEEATLCKSFDKDGVPCTEEATLRVFWPGKTTEACRKHEQKMQAVATVMGFVLDSRPIEAESRTDC